MRVSDFHFDLPEELIAQHPPAERGSSRMLVLKSGDREQGAGNREQYPENGGDAFGGVLIDAQFRDLPGFLRTGDLLVLNDSRVLPARLYATRAGLATQANSPQPSGLIEVLLTEQIAADQPDPALPTESVWRALVRPARKVRPGEMLHFFAPGAQPKQPTTPADAVLKAEVIATGEFGERTLRFAPVDDFYDRIARIGHMPLPPYIHRDQSAAPDTAEDRERYQTVYSEQLGSAAAPTAGLHFTPEILAALRARGVEIATLTLHVGLGTFQPVRVSKLKDIRLHSERYTLPTATAAALNRALAERRRIVAVGTTTTRALEHIAQLADTRHLSTDNRELTTVFPHSGSTSIFIGPGHRFRIVSGLLTNFHLPESTLLMLIAAFAGNVTAAGAPNTGVPGGLARRGEHLASEMWEGPSQSPPDRGRKTILAAYAHAIRQRYRFYSYGDCMLLL